MAADLAYAQSLEGQEHFQPKYGDTTNEERYNDLVRKLRFLSNAFAERFVALQKFKNERGHLNPQKEKRKLKKPSIADKDYRRKKNAYDELWAGLSKVESAMTFFRRDEVKFFSEGKPGTVFEQEPDFGPSDKKFMLEHLGLKWSKPKQTGAQTLARMSGRKRTAPDINDSNTARVDPTLPERGGGELVETDTLPSDFALKEIISRRDWDKLPTFLQQLFEVMSCCKYDKAESGGDQYIKSRNLADGTVGMSCSCGCLVKFLTCKFSDNVEALAKSLMRCKCISCARYEEMRRHYSNWRNELTSNGLCMADVSGMLSKALGTQAGSGDLPTYRFETNWGGTNFSPKYAIGIPCSNGDSCVSVKKGVACEFQKKKNAPSNKPRDFWVRIKVEGVRQETKAVARRYSHCPTCKLCNILPQLKSNARTRERDSSTPDKYKWNLSDQQALHILSKPCKYCGTKCNVRIDRDDPEDHYHKDNCSPCCETCNSMKHRMQVQEFEEKIIDIMGNLEKILKEMDIDEDDFYEKVDSDDSILFNTSWEGSDAPDMRSHFTQVYAGQASFVRDMYLRFCCWCGTTAFGVDRIDPQFDYRAANNLRSMCHLCNCSIRNVRRDIDVLIHIARISRHRRLKRVTINNRPFLSCFQVGQRQIFKCQFRFSSGDNETIYFPTPVVMESLRLPKSSDQYTISDFQYVSAEEYNREVRDTQKLLRIRRLLRIGTNLKDSMESLVKYHGLAEPSDETEHAGDDTEDKRLTFWWRRSIEKELAKTLQQNKAVKTDRVETDPVEIDLALSDDEDLPGAPKPQESSKPQESRVKDDDSSSSDEPPLRKPIIRRTTRTGGVSSPTDRKRKSYGRVDHDELMLQAVIRRSELETGISSNASGKMSKDDASEDKLQPQARLRASNSEAVRDGKGSDAPGGKGNLGPTHLEQGDLDKCLRRLAISCQQMSNLLLVDTFDRLRKDETDWTVDRESIVRSTNGSWNTDDWRTVTINSDKMLIPVWVLRTEPRIEHFVALARFRDKKSGKWVFAMADSFDPQDYHWAEIDHLLGDRSTLGCPEHMMNGNPDRSAHDGESRIEVIRCKEQAGTECGYRVALHLYFAMKSDTLEEYKEKIGKLDDFESLDLNSKVRTWVMVVNSNGWDGTIPQWIRNITDT